jgi:ABC-type branched-subunit amino acid transport system substrate-binding protein
MIRRVIVSAFAAAISFTTAAQCENSALGVIIPMSGPYAHFGEAGRIGLEMGLQGNLDTKVRVIYEDSQYDAAKSVSAYTKLSDIDHVSGVIILGTPPSSAVVPIAEKNGMPIFAWTPSKKITSGKPQVVRLMSSAAEQGKTMAAEVQRRGYKKIAYFVAQNEFAQSVRDGFLASYGSPLAMSEEFMPTEQDFRTSLTKARASKIDAIGLCLNTGQIPSFLGQLKQLGISVPIFGCQALSSKGVMAALQANKLSAWFVEGVVSEKFQEEFAKKSPDSSGIWLAAAFHDLGVLMSTTQLNDKLISAIEGKPIENSAFGESRVAKGPEDRYLEVSLGITEMDGSKFVRKPPA